MKCSELMFCFHEILDFAKEWSEIHTKSIPLIRSIVQSIEYINGLEKVRLEDTPFSSFPDFKPKLMYKVNQQLQMYLSLVEENLIFLENSKTQIHNVTNQTLEKYYTQPVITDDLVYVPSTNNLIEWLDDIQKNFTNDYLRLKFTFEALDYSKPITIKLLLAEWKQCHKNNEKLEMIFSNVKCFTEQEKLQMTDT